MTCSQPSFPTQTLSEALWASYLAHHAMHAPLTTRPPVPIPPQASPFIPQPNSGLCLPPGAQTVPLVSVEGPHPRGTKMATLCAAAQTLWAHHKQVPSVTNCALACGRLPTPTFGSSDSHSMPHTRQKACNSQSSLNPTQRKTNSKLWLCGLNINEVRECRNQVWGTRKMAGQGPIRAVNEQWGLSA